MTVSEELSAQRDRILFGTWVHGLPRQPGEACALFRFVGDSRTLLAMGARAVLNEAAYRRGIVSVVWWQDEPKRSKQEVLDLFDDAIRLAKEQENAEASA